MNQIAAWTAGALFLAVVTCSGADARTHPDHLPAPEPQGRQIGAYVVDVAERPHDWCLNLWVEDVFHDGKCFER